MNGIRLALLTAVISGVSIFVNGHAVAAFADATLFTTLKNVLVGAALVALVAVRWRPEVRRLDRPRWTRLAALGVIGGSVPFVLFFEGLAAATRAADAAFIHKTLFVWVAIAALAFLPKERLGTGQFAALAALLAAQLLLGAPSSLAAIGAGGLMVFAATLLWAAEVVLARRLLAAVPSVIGAAGRMGIGAVLMLAYVSATGRLDLALSGQQWLWLAVTAVLLLAYVTTWYAALERAPATAVTCVLALGAPITALLQVVSGRPAPEPATVVAYALIALAAGAFVAFHRGARLPRLARA